MRKSTDQNMQMTLSMRISIVVFVLSFLGTALSPGTTAAEARADVLLQSLTLETPVSLCGEPVPVEDPRVVERFEKEMLVSLGNRAQVILWLKRSTRFFPYIVKRLEENGLPEDIKYLAIAESALRMHAGSRKGAMGVWQLMPQTARKYGLVVDGDFDERRNLYLSTPAVMAYLRYLFDRFGSWSLSLAAYNMGEEGLSAEILEQGTTDYYRLYLPLETQRFVFRILAIKRIMEAPQKYGFALSAGDFYPSESFSTIRIDALSDLPLRLIADAAETDFKAIKDLNPELRGYYLAAGTRMVNIPADGEDGFQERLAARIQSDATLRSQRIYVVQKGDSLSGIAQKFDVPVAALLIWNRIGIKRVIHPGQRLVVFPSAGKKDSEFDPIDGDGDG
jgi:membrane-bound lytic murein transglycosylase D